MTTQYASTNGPIKVGAGMACIWIGAVALFMVTGIIGTSLGGVFLLGLLVFLVVAIPLMRDESYRNPGSVFCLLFGAFLVGAAAALIAVAFLFFWASSSGWMTNHR